MQRKVSLCPPSLIPMSIYTVPWPEGFPLTDTIRKAFLDILDGMWWTIDRNLSEEQILQSARATFIDSIKNGVTTVFDHFPTGMNRRPNSWSI